jgi:hypothetical protein
MNARLRLALPFVVPFALSLSACMTPPKSESGFAPADCDTHGGNRTCRVEIRANPSGPYRCELGRFDVSPDFLRLQGRDRVKIQFSLDRSFAFCDTDRPFLKDPGVAWGELIESYGSMAEDGARSADERLGACRPVWNWSWANSEPGAEYRFGITFRDPKSGRGCTIDPWVKNGR